MPRSSRRIILGLLAAAPNAAPRAALAEEPWPSRPVRLIVPYPPGGGADVVARLLAPALTEQPSGPVLVIENRPGAGGTIGIEALAKAAPDGYTIGTATIGTHGTNPWLFPRIGYDPIADFTPIALVSLQPSALAVPAASPLRNLDDVLALTAESNIASAGNGTSGHLAAEVLRVMAKLPLVHVPYRSSGAAWADVLGGRMPLIFDNIQNALPHHQAGRARILAVSGHARIALLPAVPAVPEQVPGYLVESWNAIAGPAGLPPAISARLATLIGKAAANPALQHRYAELGMELPNLSPAETAGFIRDQLAFWQRVIAQANIRLE